MSEQKKEKLAYWKVLRINGTPASDVGIVEAIDADGAVKAAIEKFKITDPKEQKRLIARRLSSR